MKEPINKPWGGLLSPSLLLSPKCCFDWRFWCFFPPFNRTKLSQQNEIIYLTKRGTKGMEGGVPSLSPDARAGCCRAGLEERTCSCLWSFSSPINSHRQDYQSAGLGLIALRQKSLIRSQDTTARWQRGAGSTQSTECGAEWAIQTSLPRF